MDPEFKMADSGEEDSVRVFYVPKTATMHAFQEAATMVRSIGDIRRIFTYNRPRAVVVRGTANQMALAAWLFSQLNQTAPPTQALGMQEYQYPASDENIVRLFRPVHASTPEQLQEIAKYVRSAERIPRVFICHAPPVIAMRGTASQMEAAARLIAERDR